MTGETQVDYIIAGAGAAGLMLAWRMSQSTSFQNKRILLIDKDNKTANDRSWCFWEEGTGEWDAIVHRSWRQAIFKSADFSKQFPLSPYTYKMIRAADFYTFMKSALHQHPNITWRQEEVLSYKDKGDKVIVQTGKATYESAKLFSSLLDKSVLANQKKYPYLKQHFIGWFVETAADAFDDEAVTFMDFSIPQKGNTRFMYILPFSRCEALLEYTLFSHDLLAKEEYENAIAEYLQQKGITNYKITDKEQGSIPMTAYNFRQHNSKNVLHIGTAGGWTKASSGFTFHNTSRRSKALLPEIGLEADFSRLGADSRFWYYDLLFLDVLDKHNERGAAFFSQLFKHNEPRQIFSFLDEQSHLSEEPAILLSLPFRPFIKALFRRLFI